MGSGPGRCHPGLDQGEVASEPFGEESVGLGSIADHQHRRRLGADEIGDEIGHRLLGLAGEDRLDATDGGDRRDDRTAARLESVRCRIRGVAIGADQPRTVEHRAAGDAKSCVVEVAVQSDDDGIDRLFEVGSGVRHHARAASGDGLGDSRTTRDEDTLTRLPRGTLRPSTTRRRRRPHRSRSGRARPRVRTASGSRVVGDEQDPSTAGPDCSDRLDRTGDRLVGEPHHAIEVTQHMGDPTWHPVMVPRFTPFPALRYCDPEIDDLIAPPYDVLSDADLDELNARQPVQHHPRRRSAGVGRSRAVRTGRRNAAAVDRRRRDGVRRSADVHPLPTALHRCQRRERSIVGVLGGLEVGPYGECGVLPHERITPKASTDRLDLTRATRANMSPIWGLSLADGLTELLTEPGEPVASVTIDGVEHTRRAGHRSRSHRRDQRQDRNRRRADRRRSPPIRRGTEVPRRDARGDRQRHDRRRGHACVRQRTRRGSTERRGDPPPVRRRPRRRTRRSARRGVRPLSGGSTVGRHARRDGRTRRAVSRPPRRQRRVAGAQTRRVRRTSARSTASGSRSCSRAWSTRSRTSTASIGWSRPWPVVMHMRRC